MARIEIDIQRCKGCLLCIDVCPYKLISVSDDINKKGINYVVFNDDGGKCTGCSLCAMSCPDIAIEVYR